MNEAAVFIADHVLGVFVASAASLLLICLLFWWTLQRVLDPLRERGARSLRWLDQRRVVQALVERVPGLRPLRSMLASAGTVLLFDLMLGFVILLAALLLFFEIAEQVGVRRGLAAFDEQLARALAARVQDSTLRFFAWVTHLADAQVQYLMGIGIAVLLHLRGQGLLAASWIGAVGGNGLINRALKLLFARERPVHEHGWALESGWSFPSGHASGAVAIYGMLAYVLIRNTPPAWHRPVALAAIVLILTIGFSRVILHVHYLSDVLAAFVSAGAWLLLCITLAEWFRLRRAALSS